LDALAQGVVGVAGGLAISLLRKALPGVSAWGGAGGDWREVVAWGAGVVYAEGMEQDVLNVGAHMSIAGGVGNALRLAKRYRCGCVQMFAANQRQWVRPALGEEEAEAFRALRQEVGVEPVVVHGSYLINLAAVNGLTHRRSVAALADELGRSELLGAAYYVLHPGAHMGAGPAAGLAQVAAALNGVLAGDEGRCMVLLETTAGQGSSLGWRFEELAELLGQVERPERVGVCLDTAHVWAAGYDLRSEAGYEQTMGALGDIIGVERVKVLHVNDSKTELGSRVDRHEHIGKGRLGRQAFGWLLRDERWRGRPMILETPKGETAGGRQWDAVNLGVLRRLGRRLTTKNTKEEERKKSENL